MKSLQATFLVVVVLALIPVNVDAGAAAEADPAVKIVFETSDSGSAEGTMWLARSSDNDIELIGCSLKGQTKGQRGGSNWAWCRAKAVDGVEVLCMTENPYLLDALKGISPFSFINFEFKNAVDRGDGVWISECSRFDFSTQSLHIPDFTVN